MVENDMKKKGKIKVTLSMNDVPIWLVKRFCEGIESEYNDCYWVKLMDWYRKVEAYDNFINSGMIPYEEPIQEESIVEEEQEKKEDNKTVNLMTGPATIGGKRK